QQLGGMVSAWRGGWGNENFGTHWIAFGSAAAILFVARFVSVSLPRHGRGGAPQQSVRRAAFHPSQRLPAPVAEQLFSRLVSFCRCRYGHQFAVGGCLPHGYKRGATTRDRQLH